MHCWPRASRETTNKNNGGATVFAPPPHIGGLGSDTYLHPVPDFSLSLSVFFVPHPVEVLQAEPLGVCAPCSAVFVLSVEHFIIVNVLQSLKMFVQYSIKQFVCQKGAELAENRKFGSR